MEKIIIQGLPDLPAAAERLLTAITPDGDARRSGGVVEERSVVAFYGEMGAGKTTLIKEICKQKGVRREDEVNSPSFAIVNEYRTESGEVIYHFDFYRIRDIGEVFDLGYEEYFYSGNLCLVEWPEKIEGLLPDSTVRVRLTATDEDTRTMEIEG